MSLRSAVEAALGADGALADQIEDFAPRAEQQAMARAVAEAIEADETLVVEAGTGTGKTLAYLLPALYSGRRVIISTGTKTLQDQLFHRDLPIARAAVERPVNVALLKGRANYLCLHRMEMTRESGRLETATMADELQQLLAFAGVTRTGELSESPLGSIDPRLLPRVTSTADNCLGQNCPLYADCYVMEARRRAQEADVVVVNHHLLLADWALRENGYGDVLPPADIYVLDEAHQLAETAAQFFGLSISSRQLLDLARDIRLEQHKEAGDAAVLSEHAAGLEQAVSALRLALGQSLRAAWHAAPPVAAEAADALCARLQSTVEALAPQSVRGPGLENCHRRAEQMYANLRAFLSEPSTSAQAMRVAWVETRGQGLALRLTPLNVAEHFADHRARHGKAWILTSATLSVGSDFQHFTERLGLEDAVTKRLESPFDYRQNTRLYLPQGLPEPSSPDFTEAYLQAITPVLAASRGRAFLLFTSHRALQQAANWLPTQGWRDLLVQGDAPQSRLLERFRTQSGAVLLGTQSFWEGVDVRGPALSCVMIDRLPFASPGDPVLQARMGWMREQGRNAFTEYQLPEAVISLRQGVGRLIRDQADRGVLVLGDSRIKRKPYGRLFLDSLPAMPVVDTLDEVEAFFSD